MHAPTKGRAPFHDALRKKNVEDLDDSGISNPIENKSTIPALCQQACLPKNHDLLRDVRLAIAQVRLQMADACLPMPKEFRNLQPRRMRQRLHELSRLVQVLHQSTHSTC